MLCEGSCCVVAACTRPTASQFPSTGERPSSDEVAEWLRRWTANPMGSARVSSNLILVGFHFVFGGHHPDWCALAAHTLPTAVGRTTSASFAIPPSRRSHGVMVSTQDSESCDPSSNLGGTFPYATLPIVRGSLRATAGAKSAPSVVALLAHGPP